MAIEPRRGCGYRKVGGLYLAADSFGTHCCKIPFDLKVCPVCYSGIKQSRGWTWITAHPFLTAPCRTASSSWCGLNRVWADDERVGLIWIGKEYYPNPEDFAREVEKMGLSRRIRNIPRGFKLGKTWVLFAHPKGRLSFTDEPGVWVPQVFLAVQPTRIEKIITDVQARDDGEMYRLERKGITPVVVPASDPDHAQRASPTVQLELV